MAAKRIIPGLVIKDGRIVKPLSNQNFRDLGHPAEMACRMELVGADELFLLETGPAQSSRRIRAEWVREVAHAICIPFSVQGDFMTTGEVRDVLEAGADKAILQLGSDPWLVADASARFGRCRIILASDFQPGPGDDWRTPPCEGEDDRRSLEDLVELGAGELLIRGTGGGGELALIQQAARLTIPIIATWDMEDPSGMREALQYGADGLLVTGIPHHSDTALASLKASLAAEGLAFRL
jgi:cyclase